MQCLSSYNILFSWKKVIKIHTGSYVKKCPVLVAILDFW